jgi:hypothetical protein
VIMSEWLGPYDHLLAMIGLAFESDIVLLRAARTRSRTIAAKIKAAWVIAVPVVISLLEKTLDSVLPQGTFVIMLGVPVATVAALLPLYGKYRKDQEVQGASRTKQSAFVAWGFVGGVAPALANIGMKLYANWRPHLVGSVVVPDNWGDWILVVVWSAVVGALGSALCYIVYRRLARNRRDKVTAIFVGSFISLIVIELVNLLHLFGPQSTQ